MPKRKPAAPVTRTKPSVPDSLLEFPERLREAMTDDDLNATQLAELAGVSTQLVTRALKGERRDGMQAASAIKVANALGVRVGWLLAGENPKHAGGVGVTADGVPAAEIVRQTLAQIGYQPSSDQVSQNEHLSAPKDPE